MPSDEEHPTPGPGTQPYPPGSAPPHQRAAKPRRPPSEPAVVPYKTGLFWMGVIVLTAVGTALFSSSPAVGGCFIAVGGLCLAMIVRAKRIGDRALVLNWKGIDHTGLWGTQYHVPWSEITGAHSGQRGVFLELRAPRSQFRVPPRAVGRKTGHGSLFLRDSLAIPGAELVELIETHRPER